MRNKKKKRSRKVLAVCVFVEITALLVLLTVIFWNRGVMAWMQSFSVPVVKELDVSGINSPNAVLMQVRGGKVLGAMNEKERIYPASMTKIMTAIIAMEELKSLDEEITLTMNDFYGLAERDATRAGFEPDETVSAHYLNGTEEAFVEKMNQGAQKLGMEDTHFCDCTGLHDPEHYSTVFDMAILLRYCLRNDDFREIIESPWHYTGPTNVHPDGITFYSTLFNSLPDASVTEGKILGGKTGYTDDAGLCLASYAEIGGMEYILVTAGAPAGTGTPLHVEDAQTIYNRLGEACIKLSMRS